MFHIQLRYFQYILSTAILFGIFLDSKPLIVASFVGIVLTWLSEMLSAQLDIYSEKYFVVLITLLLSFSNFVLVNTYKTTITQLFLIMIVVVSLLYFLIQKDVSIFEIGNIIFLLFIGFVLIGFISSEIFTNNLTFISSTFLCLLLLKTGLIFLNIQFTNFQFFFDFLLVALVMFVVSFFYSFETINVFIAILALGVLATLFNFMFIKLRYEYTFTKEITKQVYVFDYLVATLTSMYLANTLYILNGLF